MCTLIIFQINDNQINDWNNVQILENLKKLETIYLEHNPLSKDSAYRRKIKLIMPWIAQIDATLAR